MGAGLGFAYSSCLYDGRRSPNASVPKARQIDLGQPLFRRSLFSDHLANSLPFRGFVWDWRLIERLISLGVRWRHVDEPTFMYHRDRGRAIRRHVANNRLTYSPARPSPSC
jgi:hypothetical protein